MVSIRDRVGAIAGLLAAAALLMACIEEAPTKRRRAPATPDEDYWSDPIVTDNNSIEPDGVNGNSGAFGAAERQNPGLLGKDAGTPGTPNPQPAKTYCAGPLAAGDLTMTELMIRSVASTGDWGEWVEIQSTRDCWLKLDGVSVESPRGALAPNVAKIADGFELAPRGSFLVADSSDPTRNNGLPGKVFAWNASDVLKDDGDTLKIKVGATTIDTLTYPALNNLTPGRSFAFPADCMDAQRADWNAWSLTFVVYGERFKGTPNGPNDDVACP